jgi:hypothetical protein
LNRTPECKLIRLSSGGCHVTGKLEYQHDEQAQEPDAPESGSSLLPRLFADEDVSRSVIVETEDQ